MEPRAHAGLLRRAMSPGVLGALWPTLPCRGRAGWTIGRTRRATAQRRSEVVMIHRPKGGSRDDTRLGSLQQHRPASDRVVLARAHPRRDDLGVRWSSWEGQVALSFHIAAEVSRRGHHVLISDPRGSCARDRHVRVSPLPGPTWFVHGCLPAVPRDVARRVRPVTQRVEHHNARGSDPDPFSSPLDVSAGNPGLVRQGLDRSRSGEATGTADPDDRAPNQKCASPHADPLMTVGGPAAGLVGCVARCSVGRRSAGLRRHRARPAKFNLARTALRCFELT